MTALVMTASVRGSIADYVQAIVTVYWIIIMAYILLGWVEMFGGRIPYSRTTSAIIGFVRDAAEPYLRIFRRMLPSFGGLDLSPIIGILVLFFVGNLLATVIRG
ncbi:MAG: YggT family protein [Solirubrobacterales bacterium]|jgi:YggT family protein|nr:YggT family protein [Solirubrobacterales bacterium]